MKVKIGPYLNWWGPYQIANLLFGNPDKNRWGPEHEPGWRERWADRLGDWLAKTWVADVCQWVHDRRQRQVYVHIDNYDVWNMDDTLRLIIAPMFVKLKQVKHGSGYIDDEDVPDELKSTAPGARDGCADWDSDHNLHKRYDWLLDEMIWAFTTDHEAAKEPYYNWSAVNKSDSIDKQVKSLKVDREAVKAYDARLQKAYCLFGKYYQTFWD
jgi:hypothetical protein